MCSGARRAMSTVSVETMCPVRLTSTSATLSRQGGASCEATPGDALLLRADQAGSVESSAGTSLHSVFIDNERVLPLLREKLPRACRRLSGDAPALKLLSAWLQALSAAEVSLDGHLKAVIEAHLVDLVVMALDPRADAGQEAELRTGRSARLHAVLDQLALRSREQITAADVGAGIGISERYVRQLLEQTGRSFSEHLIELRLQNAFRILSDPRHEHRKVIDIAEEAGFVNISHFNRSFRRRFSMTPYEARPRRR